MPNTNCLEGIKCPKCGHEDDFKIEAKATFEVTDDGTGDHGDVEWDDENYIECLKCAHYGTVGEFRLQEVIIFNA